MKTKLILAISLLIWLPSAHAERNCLPEGASFPASWYENFEPHRVIGNLYSVGGVDLAVYLITTDEGHILINTGMENSGAHIQKNIKTLGFDIKDVKILLVQQSHFDHALALADLKALTGAKLLATSPDAPILEDGGKSDPHFGECLDFRFPAIKVDQIIKDRETIELGGMILTAHLHPGHTEGSSSYTFHHSEGGKDYNVIIANMGSINQGKKLVHEPTYPDVAGDFGRTYQAQLSLDIDVWVAAHASQYKRDKKYSVGQSYSPETFVDPDGYKKEILRLQNIYIKQILAEARKDAPATTAH